MITDPETEVLTITWKIADILEAMQSQEFEATEANIRKVLDYKNLKNLEDKSIEYGWGIIFDMVEEAKMNKRKIAFTPNEMSFAIGCGAKKYVDYAEAMKLFGLGRNSLLVSGVVQLVTIHNPISTGIRWVMFIGIVLVSFVLQHSFKVFRVIFAVASIFAACFIVYAWKHYDSVHDQNIAMLISSVIVAALNLIQDELEKDLKNATKGHLNNLQFSAHAIGVALRNVDGQGILSEKTETKIVSKLTEVIRTGNLSTEELNSTILAIGCICDQREYECRIEPAVITDALLAIRNIGEVYNYLIVMAQQKACEVATKMINGELLTNDEEQFLLTKLINKTKLEK